VEYFDLYEEEYKFIVLHYKKYGNVPDKATFETKFPEFIWIEVAESEDFLATALKTDKLFNETSPALNNYIKKTVEKREDAQEAHWELRTKINQLSCNISIPVKDLAQDAEERYTLCVTKKDVANDQLIKTNLQELNDLIYGWLRGEDLIIFQARPNQGKSWIGGKCALDAWLNGENVGVFTGEMSHNSVFYRIDTLYGHFSNTALKLGTLRDIEGYKTYIENLKERKNRFISVDRKAFDNRATVTKFEAIIEKYELNLLLIDQLSFVMDERRQKGEQRKDELGHITDDLLNLSIRYGIPIIAINQSKRGSTKTDKEKNAEIDDLAESDQIGQNATRVISIRQTGEGLELYKAKDRHFGKVGESVVYRWNIDAGDFEYIPGSKDREVAVRQRGDIKHGTDAF